MRKICSLFFVSLIYHAAYSQCNTHLYVKAEKSGVVIGDLDITGNNITIEARFNRTTAYAGGQTFAGDLVSKHQVVADANYLLRPNDAEITTTTGYFKTPEICDIDTNKTYYAALVYDGDTLKFYRNGFIMSKVAASGDLITNDWATTIGSSAYGGDQPISEDFIGYIDEVRIWDTARTEEEIQTYMNTSLPNPTSQPGLRAYYVFNSLQNKQGDAQWDGTIKGTANINQTNPACANYIADSCSIVVPLLLKEFRGAISGQSVNLWWTTCNEINCISHIIERSFNGSNFTPVGAAPAKGSIQINQYQFTEYIGSPAYSKVFYRLKTLDKDASAKYSKILVFPLENNPGVSLFPNPAKNYVQLTFSSDNEQETTIRVLDAAGRIVLAQRSAVNKGDNNLILSGLSHLEKGVYIVRFSISDRIVAHKLIIH